MPARLMSLLIWAAVAASAVYWGLQLFVRPTPVPGGATVAAAPLPAAGNLERLLGTPPVQQQVVEAPPPNEGRFRLVGVVAPRASSRSGLALISVDGKPPRAVAVGRELEPGLRLLTVSHRRAELGAGPGSPAMTLSLPPLAEAQRGRPGEAFAPGLPGLPGAGMPGVGRPGLGMPAQPGGMPALQPGVPLQQQADAQAEESAAELPTEGSPALRR